MQISYKKLIGFIILTSTLSQLCHAQTAEFVEEIDAEIRVLRSKNALPTFIPASVKSQEGLKNLKQMVSVEEHKKIAKEFKYFEETSNEDIDKAYLEKVNFKGSAKLSSPLSKTTQDMLTKLSLSSSEFLKKNSGKTNAVEPKVAKVNSLLETAPTALHVSVSAHPEMPLKREPSEEENEAHLNSQRLTEAAEVLEAGKKNDAYETHEDDSIFQIITKRYIKNYPKLKK